MSQVHLAKLPKNLMAKLSLAKNTEQVLHQLPHIISSLDAYIESSLQRNEAPFPFWKKKAKKYCGGIIL